jgi:hypothetical protein
MEQVLQNMNRLNRNLESVIAGVRGHGTYHRDLSDEFLALLLEDCWGRGATARAWCALGNSYQPQPMLIIRAGHGASTSKYEPSESESGDRDLSDEFLALLLEDCWGRGATARAWCLLEPGHI